MSNFAVGGGADAPLLKWEYVDAQGRKVLALIDEDTYNALVRAGRIKPNNQAKPGPVGNTQGIIVPQTSPNTSGASSAPTPAAPSGKEGQGWWKSWGSTATHGVLDVIGLVPVFGEVANAIGGAIYPAEGDPVSAALDFAAMWPAGGQAATAAKYGTKAGGAVLEPAAKKADDVAEIAAKQSDEAAQAAGKKADDAQPPKKDDGGKVKKNCKPLENGVPGMDYRGGRHSEIQRGGSGYDPPRESHHMPADSTYDKINGKPVSSGYKPSIQMDKVDHEKTASWGSSKMSEAYRDTQSKLIKQGKAGYLAAMLMDVADVRPSLVTNTMALLRR